MVRPCLCSCSTGDENGLQQQLTDVFLSLLFLLPWACLGLSSSFLFASLQVEDESSQSAVYVNVAQLRQSISKTPPSCSPSYLDLNGWEVHVDQESGQEYYYHPDTGQTTWDKPFLDSPTYPESLTAENPLSPSPPLSPAFSPSTASLSSVRTSDWEQLVDETSGRAYFYNPMSGETTWEPPEQLSPYPPMMEPMSVHRFHEDVPVRTVWLLYFGCLLF